MPSGSHDDQSLLLIPDCAAAFARFHGPIQTGGRAVGKSHLRFAERWPSRARFDCVNLLPPARAREFQLAKCQIDGGRVEYPNAAIRRKSVYTDGLYRPGVVVSQSGA